MYGPTSAPGMRQNRVSILKYIFKPKKGGPADIWQPSELDDEDGANEKEEGAMSSALAAEILPPILALIPRLRDSRPAESAAAAAEFVALTNNSSKDEDVVIGKTGALEVLAQVMWKSTPEGRTAAASALANLLAQSDANKSTPEGGTAAASALANLLAQSDANKSDANKAAAALLPEVLSALVAFAASPSGPASGSGSSSGSGAGAGAGAGGEKNAGIAARALLNLASNKTAAAAIAATYGATEALAGLVLTGKTKETKEDAAHVLSLMVSHSKDVALAVINTEQALHALRSAARSTNCTGETRLWCVSALHAISRCSRARLTILRAKVLDDVFLPLLSADDLGDPPSFEKPAIDEALATMAIANLTGWDDTCVLSEFKPHVFGLVHIMATAITQRDHGGIRFRNAHVLQALWSLVPNDEFKAELVGAKLLELSIDM
ncbi:hypothetical protein T484DRAFT_1892203, partial [Baffinella frigidus]